MTRAQLIEAIASAISYKEGFHVTEEQAKRSGMRWPTRAQRNNNPGNIRRWSRGGKPFPMDGGYAVFPSVQVGWDILHALVGQYIDGKYTGGTPPTLRQMFKVYAPAEDANDPTGYAAFVASAISDAADAPVTVDMRLKDLISPEAA